MAVTYHDLIEHGQDWLRSTTREDERAVKRAVRAAMRTVASAHRWAYLTTRWRLTTSAAYSTGTLAITAGTTAVTLTDGTFPSWAASGELTVDGDEPAYQVKTRTDGTHLVLDSDTPYDGSTVTAADYSLQRVTYDLPADFQTTIDPQRESIGPLTFVSYEEWLAWRRRNPTTTGDIQYCTVIGSPDTRQRLVLAIHPVPDEAKTFDLLYQRWPRNMSQDYATEAVTGTADSTTITGDSTVWTSSMAGAVMRFGDTTDGPDGPDGDHPYVEEHFIDSVTDATHLELETALDDNQTAVKYRISDPMDLDEHVCLAVVQRAIEYQIDAMHGARRGQANPSYYALALRAAKAADSPMKGDQHMGPTTRTPRRIADMMWLAGDSGE